MDERSWKEVRKDAWYNALLGGITSVLFGTADIISGGNGKLPTAEDLEAITTQAAEETVSSIAKGTPEKQTNTDTAINDNPAEHTPAEQAVIERYKAASDTSLRKFIEKVRGLVNNDYKNKIRHDINTETDRALVEARNITGTDTNGYKQIIKGNAIQHIDKRHGSNGKADHSMSNIDDFSRIGFVLDNFTDARVIPADELDAETAKLSREWRNSDGNLAPLIAFSMPVNGTYYVVEAVPDSNAKVLAVVSAYISSKTKRSTLNQELSLAENTTQQLTSETVPEILRTSKFNIPQSKNIVNGKTTSGAPTAIYAARLKELGLTTDDGIYTNYKNRQGEAFKKITENSYNVLENDINNDITDKDIYMDVIDAPQAKKALAENVGFVRVDSSLDSVDEALLTVNANQLIKLENIFGVIHKSLGNICSISDGGSVAFVNATITNPAIQTLSLCPEHYKSYSLLVE
ncbi:MAG: hypothetical protein J6P94_06060, partial [Oscillospiraceae bacterium]|nr:hypothetical protein [Oscillospiraceae bacterium]